MLKKFKQLALQNMLMHSLENFDKKSFFSIDYLIHNSNLGQTNKYGWNPLNYILKEDIKISKEQLNYLIYNTDLNSFNSDWIPLMLVLSNKKIRDSINKEQFDYLIYNTNLNIKNKNGWNALMCAFAYNKEQKSNLSREQYDYLIHNASLYSLDEDNWNALMFALRYNKERELNLSKEQIEYLINNTDLNIKSKNGWNALMFALTYNKEQELNLSKEQFDYLIHNAGLNTKSKDNWNALMFALRYNKVQELNLSREQFDYLIHNTDLNAKNKGGRNALMFALRYNKEQELNLSREQFDYLKNNVALTSVNSDGWDVLMLALRFNKEQSIDIDLNDFILNTAKEQINTIRMDNYGYNYLLTALEHTPHLSSEALEYLLINSNLEWRSESEENWIKIYFDNIENLNHPVSQEITKKIFEYAQENTEDAAYIFSNLVKLNKSEGFKLEDPHFNFLIEQIKEGDLYPLLKSYVRYSNNVELKESTVNKILINTTLNIENVKEIIDLASINNCLSSSQWRFILVNTTQYGEKDQISLLKSLENIKPTKLSEELLSFCKIISNNKNLEQSFISFVLNPNNITNKNTNLTFEELSQRKMFKVYLQSRTDEQLECLLTKTDNIEDRSKIKETIEYLLGKSMKEEKDNIIDKINKFKNKFKSEIDNKSSLAI